MSFSQQSGIKRLNTKYTAIVRGLKYHIFEGMFERNPTVGQPWAACQSTRRPPQPQEAETGVTASVVNATRLEMSKQRKGYIFTSRTRHALPIQIKQKLFTPPCVGHQVNNISKPIKMSNTRSYKGSIYSETLCRGMHYVNADDAPVRERDHSQPRS